MTKAEIRRMSDKHRLEKAEAKVRLAIQELADAKAAAVDVANKMGPDRFAAAYGDPTLLNCDPGKVFLAHLEA
jgi:hypothetical protein